MFFRHIFHLIFIILFLTIISLITLLVIYPVNNDTLITSYADKPKIFIPPHLRGNVIHYGNYQLSSSKIDSWFFLKPTLKEDGSQLKKIFVLADHPLKKTENNNLFTLTAYLEEARLLYSDKYIYNLDNLEDLIFRVIKGEGKAFLHLSDLEPPLKIETLKPVYYSIYREGGNPLLQIIAHLWQKPSFHSESDPNFLKLSFVGDIMLSRGVGLKIDKYGLNYPFQEVESYLREADILFGNLESVISDKGSRANQTITFRAKPDTVNILTNCNFTILSKANNHALDYGRNALLDSIKRLQIAGIKTVGAGSNLEEASKPVILDINGLKIGFLAYNNIPPTGLAATENSPGVNYFQFDRAIKQVQNLKKEVNLLIATFHWGVEYTHQPTIQQIEIADSLIKEGVDIIIGHHPHVLQPIEIKGKKIIAYSLGNFLFDQDFSEETSTGGILSLTLYNSKIVSLEFKPTFIHEERLSWIQEPKKLDQINNILKFNTSKDLYRP